MVAFLIMMAWLNPCFWGFVFITVQTIYKLHTCLFFNILAFFITWLLPLLVCFIGGFFGCMTILGWHDCFLWFLNMIAFSAWYDCLLDQKDSVFTWLCLLGCFLHVWSILWLHICTVAFWLPSCILLDGCPVFNVSCMVVFFMFLTGWLFPSGI